MSGEFFDTIVAPATPAARSALAMVRIDGPLAPNILLKLTGRAAEPRVATLSVLRRTDGAAIDEGVSTLFAGPASFTGNDLVEVTLHGNPLLVEQLVTEILTLGARLAEPGEFTERAVLNGKIDFLQAEAIAELIDSRTELQASLALSHLSGSLSRTALGIRAELLELLTLVEGALDFADEGYEFIHREDLVRRLALLENRLDTMIATFRRGRAMAEGVTLVLLGKPNAGKSTLLNLLVGADRAIVTELPGTTRDVLREAIVLAGLPVTVVDTAGLRETGDRIEEIGVRRAREAAVKAAFVLYLIDATTGLTSEDETEIARLVDPLIVYTKVDLAAAPGGAIGVSSEQESSIANLVAAVSEELRSRFDLSATGPAITTARQLAALHVGREAVESARHAAVAGSTEEYVAADLYRASQGLHSLIGGTDAADARREIFRRFCIGK